jgi:hypothetical protein
METSLLSDTEQEERGKPQLLPEEEDLLAFLRMGGAAGNTINSVMPHRSIEEWSAWVDHRGNSRRSQKLPSRLRDLDRVGEFIDSKIAVISKAYPKWYPDAPMEKPATPVEINQFPILTGMDFDIIRWYSLLPGKRTSTRELDYAIDDVMAQLCDNYPHMSMPYLEKFAKNRFDPQFYMKAREAAAFFEEYERLYDDWLAKAFPEYYASGVMSLYKFVEKRVVDAETWKVIENIINKGENGKQVMYKLLDYLPAKLVHEAFYRSSGLSQPALKFMKTYGDVSVPISGIWTETHDLNLIDNDLTVIGKLHGPTNIAVRKRFLASKVPHVKKRSDLSEEPLTVEVTDNLSLSGLVDCPSPQTLRRVMKQGSLDPEAVAQSKKLLKTLPDSEFADTADFIESVYED